MRKYFLLVLLLLTSSCTSRKVVTVNTPPETTHQMEGMDERYLSTGDDMSMADHDAFAAAGMTHVLSYTSHMFQYVVSIPQEWRFDDHKGAYLGSEGDVVFYPPAISSQTPHAPFIVITSPDTGTSMSTQVELTAWLAKPITSEKNTSVYKVATLTVAAMPAVQYVEKSAETYHLITWFRKNDRNFYVQLGNTESDVIKYRQQYDFMLEKISFIE